MRGPLRITLMTVVAVLAAPLPAGAGTAPDIAAPALAARSGRPEVIPAVGPGVFEGDLRDLPVARRIPPRLGGYVPVGEPPAFADLRTPRRHPDRRALPTPALRNMNAAQAFTTPERSFDGMGGRFPPDPVGDIGPDHYIQMVNTTFQIYDKDGNGLLLDGIGNPAPRNINSLWKDFGGQCETTNRGDPIVLYDQLADRWLLSQFAFDRQDLDMDGNAEPVIPWFECVAISQTPDPVSGGWFLYAIQSPDEHFPDYPKLGIMPDAYYLTTIQTGGEGGGNYALDRVSMLAGGPANSIYFNTNDPPYSKERLLPADMDGTILPPAGAPGIFMRPVDGPDTIELWEFHADFATPANSTFTLAQSLSPTAFDISAGGAPQPTDDELLEVISDRFMHRLAYRSFGAVETLVASHVVDVDGTNHGGIRWYQLARAGGAWFITQEGDHAPDTDHRWNPSIAMDRDGNIALGYSVSSASTFPSARYAGRLVGDPPGTLPQGEGQIAAGGGSQNACASPQPNNCRSRWGDYSSVNVDPEDDCTFWYTNEYIGPGPSRRTAIGAFRFCNDAPTADIGGPYATPEGTAVLLDASDSDDPNPTDTLTFEWELDGDAQFDDDAGPVALFRRGDNGAYPVEVRVTDSSGETDTASTVVTVTNVAPTVTLDPAQITAILEGDTVDVAAGFSDPGWEDTYTAEIDWGHPDLGTDPVPAALTTDSTAGPGPDLGTAAGSKQVGDDGSFSVTVTVTDDDGGTGADGFTLEVANVAPDAEIDLTGAILVNGVPTIISTAGDPVDFSGDATDPGSDDLELTWSFDDGTPLVTVTSLVNPPGTDPDPSPTVQARAVNDMQTHTFADACAYEPSFTAEDDDGGIDASTAAVLITGTADQTRPAAWWKHQYDQSGQSDFDEPTLLCYLKIARFVSAHYDEVRPLSTLQDAEDVYHAAPGLTAQQRQLDRELVGALLNFANGAVGYGEIVVDTDADGVPDLSFGDAVAQAEAVRADPGATKGDLQQQRQLVQQINQ